MERRTVYGVVVGKLEGKRLLGIPRGVDGAIILRWIFGKWDGADWIYLAQYTTGCWLL